LPRSHRGAGGPRLRQQTTAISPSTNLRVPYVSPQTRDLVILAPRTAVPRCGSERTALLHLEHRPAARAHLRRTPARDCCEVKKKIPAGRDRKGTPSGVPQQPPLTAQDPAFQAQAYHRDSSTAAKVGSNPDQSNAGAPQRSRRACPEPANGSCCISAVQPCSRASGRPSHPPKAQSQRAGHCPQDAFLHALPS
jgi:hypothetical protein